MMIRAVLVWLCLCAPAQADPAFDAALGAWLQGDEAASLPAFATAARGGDTRARILLSRIDAGYLWQGDWLRKLGRSDRIALMRRPGGLSGRSWMQVAADSDPSAALWMRLAAVDAPPQIIAELDAVGEPRAAAMAARMYGARHRVSDFGGAGALPAALAPFADARGTPGPGGLPDLSDHPMISALCAARCGGDIPACTAAVYAAIGGYLGAISLGPPSERIISMEVFASSPMGQMTTLRAMRGAMREPLPACLQ